MNRSQLVWGWTALAASVALGLGLEALHAFKAGFYLDAEHETRRLLWRLAHAHGTLLGLLHLAFAATAPSSPERTMALAGRLLKVATVLLPGGFLLGGLRTYGGDPGVGVLLTPVGGVALLVAVTLTALAARR